jgi:CspA family cold shock protein
MSKRKTFTMPTGTVRFYRDGNGYGFIQPDEVGRDVFVHASAVRGFILVVGQRVEYEVGINPRTGREAATRVQPRDPIISPRTTAFTDDDAPGDAEQLAQTAFMRR